ncbi:hypothetical protein BDZ45DRAFT_764681 [Acephala macrosclerotiorum]|nr:hypothetical protein BDZ45DRAFT_764681 [Acephala macrosclerotiorum]
MCVKEFLGYNCGHCSIPYLRQCPITESNPIYPPCKIPAERPIFTNENCHACARVLWNQKVLKEEAVHRQLHQDGLCECEVIFDAEERERRMRPRGSKTKGKGRELVQAEHIHGYDREVSSAGEGGGGGLHARHVSEDPRTNPYNTMGGGEPSQHQQQQRSTWASDTKLAAYEYVGYYVGNNKRQGSALAHVEKGYGFPDGGYVHEEQLWEGQLRMGQPGSGMKWYPEQSLPVLPGLPALPPVPSPSTYTDRTPRTWQRAASEPAEPSEYLSSPAIVLAEVGEVIEVPQVPAVDDSSEQIQHDDVPSGPLVVSSDMAKTVSD